MDKKKLLEWKTMDAALKALKEREMDLRKEIVNEIVTNIKGKVSLNMDGLKVKASKVVNTKIALKGDDFYDVFDTLSDEEKACFVFKPDIVAKNLKALEDRKNVNAMLESKPGAPKLIVEFSKE